MRRDPPIHGISFDIEDWWHVLGRPQSHPPDLWNQLDCRVLQNTERILATLSRHQVRATFFVLGWVAERHPDLVLQISEAGHEIGSHGFLHRLTSEHTRDTFSRDLDRSLVAIQRATGKEVSAFRAPGFSINEATYWAFEVLWDHGIRLDSSLFLGYHPHGGVHLRQRGPFQICLPGGKKLLEVPITGFALGSGSTPFSGGGYLRAVPLGVLGALLRSMDRRGHSVVMYAHPRDFDPDEPRLDLPTLRSFRHYYGSGTVARKVDLALTCLPFVPLGEVVRTSTLDRDLELGGLQRSVTGTRGLGGG